MVVDIHYPVNQDEWYAKGTLEGGGYFEVPAVFYPDGSCNIEETDAKVQQLILTLNARP